MLRKFEGYQYHPEQNNFQENDILIVGCVVKRAFAAQLNRSMFPQASHWVVIANLQL